MEKINRDLLDVLTQAIENPSMKLSTAEKDRLDRLRDLYAHILEHPLESRLQLRNYLMNRYDIGRAMAYQDIGLVTAVFGNVQMADKELRRFQANELLSKASAAAMAGDEKRANSLIKVAMAISKVNRLDENEGEQLPWDEIEPKDYSFTIDPAVIGIEKEPGIEEKSRKLLQQYTQEIDSK